MNIQNLTFDKLEMIYVEWVDIVGDPQNGWKDDVDSDKFFEREDNLVKEVGFLWAENDEYIYLVGKYMPGDVYLSAHRTIIPKGCIKYREVLKNVKTTL